MSKWPQPRNYSQSANTNQKKHKLMNANNNPTRTVEQPIDERKSLEIISRMIADTSQKIEQNSSYHFLAWGYTTVLISVFEYFVWVADLNKSWLWAWWLIPVIGGIATYILNRRQNQLGARPKSYVDRSVSAVWTVLGLSSLYAYFVFFDAGVFLFLIVFMMGIGTTITGEICRQRLLTVCGAVSILLAVIFPLKRWFITQYTITDPAVIYADIIIFAAIFVVMMIVPGHIFIHRAKKQQNNA